jgi:DNA-binding LacI/PurR family transcriptional regulator
MSASMKKRFEEVAHAAGVSLATVYRVMNSRGHAVVRASTEERVREAAASLAEPSHFRLDF